MTTIRKLPARSDDAPSEEGAHLASLPPGRLRAHTFSASLVWMIPAAAGLAGLLVFGLDASGEKKNSVQPASIEAPATGGPVTTGSLTPTSPPDRTLGGAASPRPTPAPPVARVGPAAPPAAAPAPPRPSPAQAPEGSRIAAVPWLSTPPQEAKAPTPIEAPRRASQPPALKLSPEDIAAHLARGEDKLKNGELAAARLYFERVALAGDQRGALGMARTYDPAVLAGLPVLGPQADAAAARQWYQRATSQRAGR